MDSEQLRIETWVARLGLEQAKAQALMVSRVYERCLDNPDHYASQVHWRPRFAQAIHELRRFVFEDSKEVDDV